MNETIEVEVLEIDGAAPVPPVSPSTSSGHDSAQPPWKAWQGRIRTLDSRWWPLWIVLGALLVGLLLTVGVVIGAILLVVKIIAGIVGAILRLFIGDPPDTRLRR